MRRLTSKTSCRLAAPASERAASVQLTFGPLMLEPPKSWSYH